MSTYRTDTIPTTPTSGSTTRSSTNTPSSSSVSATSMNHEPSSSSLRLLTHPDDPLLRYCRTGQWQCILDYFEYSHYDVSSSSSSSSSPSSILDGRDVNAAKGTANRYQKNHNHHIDDRCLQYVIRSTTTHQKYNRSDTDTDDDEASVVWSRQQKRVMETLLQHHPGLISIVHPLTGTIVHEAIQFHNHNHIILYLLQQMLMAMTIPKPPLVECDGSITADTTGSDDASDDDFPLLRRCYFRQPFTNYNIHQIPFHLFQVQDDIGRTILHCLIGRWQRNHWYNNAQHDTTTTAATTVTHLQLFRTIVRAHPLQISVPDLDGYTPLLQLLQTTTTPNNTSGWEDERHRIPMTNATATTTTTELSRDNEMYEMIHCMIQYQPNVVTILKRIPYYFRYTSTEYQPPSQRRPNNHGSSNTTTAATTAGSTTSGNRNAIHAPLFYALLYGQSQPTIQLLLETHRQVNDTPYSSLILSQYQEAALHIAITTSASISILQCIVNDCRQSTILCTDMYQLTPIDWLWLVHLREYSNIVFLPHHPPQHPHDRHNNNNNVTTNDPTDPAFQHLSVTTQRLRQIISRRRHLSDHIIQWHRSISIKQQERVVSLLHNSTTHDNSALPWPIDHRREYSVDAAAIEWLNTIHNQEHDLLRRLQILLPSAASTLWQEQQQLSIDVIWSDRIAETPFDDTETKATNLYMLLHAACYVPCPVTVIQLILLHLHHHRSNQSQPQKQQRANCVSPMNDSSHFPWRYRDSVARRYPLHYAADRVSYGRNLPIGFTLPTPASASTATPNGSHLLREDLTPVQVIAPLYPDACTHRDASGQLPLHIVIDTYKRYRRNYYTRSRRHQKLMVSRNEYVPFDGTEINHYNKEQDNVIDLLIQLYPGSIQQRDGRTMLYPYQQAAAGPASIATSDNNDGIVGNVTSGGDNEADVHGCRLTTIYQLLRFDPTLIH